MFLAVTEGLSMKLIVFPLVMLIGLAMLSMMGVGTIQATILPDTIDSTFVAAADGFYDATGHMVCDEYEVDTDEAGCFNIENNNLYWLNSTNWTPDEEPTDAWNDYPIWLLKTGETLGDKAEGQGDFFSFDTLGTWGMIGIFVGIIALAAVVGLRVFGSGISETSVSTIVMATAFGSIWLLFSALAYGLLAQIPLLGLGFYFFLTALYTLGVFNKIGGSGGSD